MTELEQLRQRRELVVLAAELQRATLVRRLDRIEANPARAVLNLAANAVARPTIATAGLAALKFAVRAWRRRSARKKH